MASRLLVLVYLAASPESRQEIGRNYRRVFGCNGRRFWLKQAWRLGGNLALMSRIGQRSLDKWLDRTRFSGDNILEQIMLRERKAIVLSLHYGLWELLPQVFARRGYQACVGLGGQFDREFGNSLLQLRAGHGVRMTESIAEMRRAARAGQLVGFALDNTSRTRGVECDTIWPGFRLLRTPFALARAERAVLVPMFMFQDGDHPRVEICEPVASAREFGTQARRMIEARPEDWLFWGKG
jgi:lauroyl/myristoyl acyltransferase